MTLNSSLCYAFLNSFFMLSLNKNPPNTPTPNTAKMNVQAIHDIPLDSFCSDNTSSEAESLNSLSSEDGVSSSSLEDG